MLYICSINNNKTKIMKVVLENVEAMSIFHTALCNGLSYFGGYGLHLDFEKRDYELAKLKLETPCYEDVLVQILKDGGKLVAIDDEGDDDYIIVEGDVYERMVDVPINNLQNIIDETDDAIDADVILQTIFLKEVVFG